MSGKATWKMAVLNALASGQMKHVSQLEAEMDIKRQFIINTASRLVIDGYIERTEKGVYRITKAGKKIIDDGIELKSGKPAKRTGVRKMRADSLRQRMWNAMRHQGGKPFSLPDILTVALKKDEETTHTYNNAGQYMRQLKKTGFLLTLTRRQPGTAPGSNGFQLYKVIRDNGDTAPVVRVRKKQVFDPNTREVFSW